MKNLSEYHKRKVIIIDHNGKTRKYSIKSFIPMQYHNGVEFGDVLDVEVLLDKSRNHFFSIDSFLKGDSWVKKIYFTGDKDKRLTKQPVISKFKRKQMKAHHYNQAEDFFMRFLKSAKKELNNE